MTVSSRQAWINTTAASAPSATHTMVSNPTSGEPVMCFAVREAASGTLSISDNFGDGVSWILIKGPITQASGLVVIYGWYKVAGTTSNKIITITNSTNAALAIYAGQYQSSVGGVTWQLNGTATSNTGTSTTPDPGGVVAGDANPMVIVGFQANDGGAVTAVTNWTNQSSDTAVSANSVEDRFIASAATYDPSWTGAPAGTNWAAIGVAIEAVPGGSTRPVKMAGEWGGFAGTSGGFAG